MFWSNVNDCELYLRALPKILSGAKYVRVWRKGRMILRRKSRSTWRKTYNITTSHTKIPTWNCLGSKLWFCLERMQLTKPWHSYQLVTGKLLFHFIFGILAILIAGLQDLLLSAFLKLTAARMSDVITPCLCGSFSDSYVSRVTYTDFLFKY
jgi:hypothetical protein